MKTKTDAYLIWKWQQCEAIALRLGTTIESNADNIISIIHANKFLYNAETVGEVHAFLTAMEQVK
jgi:hypothetical protein